MQNKFLNLTNLTIDNVHKGNCTIHMKSIIIPDEENPNIIRLPDLARIIDSAIEEEFTILDVHQAILAPQLFRFIIVADELTGENEIPFFETCVNLILSSFFNYNLHLQHGRNREHRLDVPSNLVPYLHVSSRLVKAAINYQTLFDCFNIEVSMGNLRYSMIGNNGGATANE